YSGPFVTINGFRLGRQSNKSVDWAEINAGLGQAAVLLVVLVRAMGIRFKKYIIVPLGSHTKIARKDDGRILYNLYTDEGLSLFPRRNFNLALKAFLDCVGEASEFVESHDPTLAVPHKIEGGEVTGTVGGLAVALGSSYEEWTRALKFMLTDIKWMVAWVAKYGSG
ncbi:unnamed protein product, partial [Chrysoparadoxa australica]